MDGETYTSALAKTICGQLHIQVIPKTTYVKLESDFRLWKPKHTKTKVHFANYIRQGLFVTMAKRDIGPILAKIREISLGVSDTHT